MYKRVQEPGVMLRLTEGGRADREEGEKKRLRAQVVSDSFLHVNFKSCYILAVFFFFLEEQ